ncbi:hypothetical protein AB8810_20580 [Xanthomonas sp. NCPPB 3005]|uniref:hypothetical protein n=1 Tax=Xanthomonas sp. NCPPB 3005 TaxID=3240913 RepID=UPI0035154733
MAGYSYNRDGFTSAGAHHLKAAYCNLVAIELALKEFLGKINTRSNGGHNVPDLLQQYASGAGPGNAGNVNALATQLSGALNALWCQDRGGIAVNVPASCYPYLRYLRHNSDGWESDYSTDDDMQNLANIVSSTRALLKTAGVML